jgi:regulator of sigma E protease
MEIFTDAIVHMGNIIIYYLLPFCVVLGVMIFFHELGHFLTAKYFGVKVLKFALGFGPKLVSKVVGDTEYSVRYIPLGGFVKMLGEDIEDEESQNLTPEESQRAFHHQHVLKRMAIVVAGPFFNLFLAIFLFWSFFFAFGDHIMVPRIGQITPNSPAERAGFQKGDIIQAIEGKAIDDWSQIRALVHDKAGVPLKIKIKRSDTTINITVVPEMTKEKIRGQEVKYALIGIVSTGELQKLRFGPWAAAKEAAIETWGFVKLTFLVIFKLIKGELPIKLLGGPIMIGQMTGEIAQESFPYLIRFMGIISINLGILNLLPIPILDGGILIFLLMELFLGRPLSLKKREFAMKVGLFLLILLMVIVTFNDISRVIEKIIG